MSRIPEERVHVVDCSDCEYTEQFDTMGMARVNAAEHAREHCHYVVYHDSTAFDGRQFAKHRNTHDSTNAVRG